METANHYNVAVYCRLSKDDDNKAESSSISNQKIILTKYVEQQKWHIFDYYCDDGVSGTTFNRPDFNRMIEDVDNGKVNLVITKDLSRLGRDYIKTGFYTEVYFAEKQVRYIALNDGIDTIHNDNDIAPFKNILNEMYAKDCSRKIKSAYKIKAARGDHHGAYAPFGYKKDPNQVGKLLIDEESGETVKLIFSLSAQGYGANRIRTYLVEHKCLTPAAYLHRKNPKYFEDYFRDKKQEDYYAWSVTAVTRILKDEVYLGKIIHGKEISLSYKTKERKSQTPDKWTIVEGTHEPLVDLETWNTIKERCASKSKPNKQNEVHMFSRLVKCADCGWAMNLCAQQTDKRAKNPKIERRYFHCGKYRQYGNTQCSTHNISYPKLCMLVLDDIRTFANFALVNEQELLKTLTTDGNEKISQKHKQYQKDLERAQKRLNELDILFPKLYEDNAKEALTDRNFALMSTRYQNEQNELTVTVSELEKQLKMLESAVADVSTWVELIRQYADVEELNASLLNELIEKIEIHERTNIDGVRHQRIDIYYRFVGLIRSNTLEEKPAIDIEK
jgi:DNA invertase Pin-like site-specific DNA recombinase